MVASNARSVLRKENELLVELADSATNHANNTSDDVERAIFKEWAAYFGRHRAINEQLINGNDQDFDNRLNAEISLLQSQGNSVGAGIPIAQFWKQNYSEDVEISKKLL